MNVRRQLLVLLIVTLAGTYVSAERVDIFRATDTQQWIRDGVCVEKTASGNLFFRECSPNASHGNAMAEDRFPLTEQGRVRFNVRRIKGGDVTLQILYFKGRTFLESRDLASHVSFPKTQNFLLSDMVHPEGADQISFKLWVAGVDDGGFELAELAYEIDVASAVREIDEHFDQSYMWEARNAWLATYPDGREIRLEQDKRSGTIVYSRQVERSAGGVMLVEMPDVYNGLVDIVATGLDTNGSYKGSVKLFKRLGTGVHIVELDGLPWPEEVQTYGLEISLAGEQDASAALKRLVLVQELTNSAVLGVEVFARPKREMNQCMVLLSMMGSQLTGSPASAGIVPWLVRSETDALHALAK